MTSRPEVKKELIETDSEFRRLYEEHQDYERRLGKMTSSPSPSSDAEVTIKGLKVQKLHLKDQMEAMIQSHL